MLTLDTFLLFCRRLWNDYIPHSFHHPYFPQSCIISYACMICVHNYTLHRMFCRLNIGVFAWRSRCVWIVNLAWKCMYHAVISNIQLFEIAALNRVACLLMLLMFKCVMTFLKIICSYYFINISLCITFKFSMHYRFSFSWTAVADK